MSSAQQQVLSNIFTSPTAERDVKAGAKNAAPQSPAGKKLSIYDILKQKQRLRKQLAEEERAQATKAEAPLVKAGEHQLGFGATSASKLPPRAAEAQGY